MPLKTYLPDGDIDLTALCPENDEEDFARDVCTLLEGERQMGSEFRVEDISYIRAKVLFTLIILYIHLFHLSGQTPLTDGKKKIALHEWKYISFHSHSFLVTGLLVIFIP